jgi:hypothetical protein
MNKFRFITLFATITMLSGCLGGGAITVKDATGFIAGQSISNATDSDAVVVTDARIKKNWSRDASTNPSTNPVQIQQPHEDKTSQLFWFFFAMMAMGMLGAGIIGMIEAFSGTNSLSTKQEERTAPIREVKSMVKLNKDGTSTDV